MKAKKSKRGKRKRSTLEDLRQGSEAQFNAFHGPYTRTGTNVACLGTFSKGYLQYETYESMDRTNLDVILVPFYLSRVVHSRGSTEEMVSKCARHLALGGYVVGATFDGRSIIEYPGAECDSLSNQSVMISKSNRITIPYGTEFTLGHDKDLVVDYEGVTKLFEQARFREVQSKLVGPVRFFCFQLCCRFPRISDAFDYLPCIDVTP